MLGLNVLMGGHQLYSSLQLDDSQQSLPLVVHRKEIRLDDFLEDEGVLPKRRDVLRRLARDPVSQIIVFELVIRMFFLHVLRMFAKPTREQPLFYARMCSNGVAASTTTCGIFLFNFNM